MTDVNYQYVWDQRYIDAAVVRFFNSDFNLDNTYDDAADNILYYMADGNFNVTGLVDVADGEVVERYMYEPYGKVTILHGVRNCQGTDTSEDEWQERTTYDFDNEILYCGYRWDRNSGLYQVRYRYLQPTLGRWTSRDPIGYADGMSLYEHVQSAPTIAVDPFGTLSLTGWLFADEHVDLQVPCSGSSRQLRVIIADCCPFRSNIRKIAEAVCSAYKTLLAAERESFGRDARTGLYARPAPSPTTYRRLAHHFGSQQGVRTGSLADTHRERHESISGIVGLILRDLRDELDDPEGTYYECEDPCSNPRTYAYVERHPFTFAVHICPPFFTGKQHRDRVWTIIHELTHLYQDTEDYDDGAGRGLYYPNMPVPGTPYRRRDFTSDRVQRRLTPEQLVNHADSITAFAMRYYRP